MNLNLIETFLNQHVEVYINNKTYSGILSFSALDQNVIEIQPVEAYTAKKYGPALVSIDSIISIRQVKPRPKEDEWDDCEKCDEDCDVAVPYIPDALNDFLEEKKG